MLDPIARLNVKLESRFSKWFPFHLPYERTEKHIYGNRTRICSFSRDPKYQ